MDADTQAKLRRGIEALVQSAAAQSREHGHCSIEISRHGAAGGQSAWMAVYARLEGQLEFTPLTPAQQLGLSVLIEDETVLPQALADYLLDYGHEYAEAVRQQARTEERQKCVAALEFASRQMRILLEEAPEAPFTVTPERVIELLEWARNEVESDDQPAGG
ncbi:MAG: hypothetical protein MUF18_05245 [Fimbriiglobus sp.]|jgi:hypothetical protein|nr:hypothetical protein [Fimbriiglobus sp.]